MTKFGAYFLIGLVAVVIIACGLQCVENKPEPLPRYIPAQSVESEQLDKVMEKLDEIESEIDDLQDAIDLIHQRLNIRPQPAPQWRPYYGTP